MTSSTAAIELEIEAALGDANIFPIGSYGWLNENDPDPDLIGHAMWQLDQPDSDHNALMGLSAVTCRPTEVEKEIASVGTDFCTLMDLSRLSIGLALVWRGGAANGPFNQGTFFWLHHTDAFLKMAMASDRLRQFLIWACTGASAKDFDQVRGNRLFVAPFKKVSSLLRARNIPEMDLSEAIQELPGLATVLFTRFISRRNEIVHEFATQIAKLNRESMEELQRKFDDQAKHGFRPPVWDFASIKESAARRTDELEQQVSTAIAELIEWYSVLVNASSYVFQVERLGRDSVR